MQSERSLCLIPNLTVIDELEYHNHDYMFTQHILSYNIVSSMHIRTRRAGPDSRENFDVYNIFCIF
jgi:hypothetical protein